MKCDFCSDEHVVWLYTAKEFEIVILAGGVVEGLGSDGGWMACQECSEMIDAGKRKELTDKSVKTLIESGMVEEANPESMRSFIEVLHDGFWNLKMGNKYPAVFFYARNEN